MPARVVPFGPSKTWGFLGQCPLDKERYWDKASGKKRCGVLRVTEELVRQWGKQAKIYPKPGHWFFGAEHDFGYGMLKVYITGPDMPEVDEGAMFTELRAEECVDIRWRYR